MDNLKPKKLNQVRALRHKLAKGVSSAITWGLVNIAHSEAGNMPGKIALYVAPNAIAYAAAEKLR